MNIIRCRDKFLRFFPEGFYDDLYLSWERNYKWEAHKKWKELLSHEIWQSLLDQNAFDEIANRAIKIESRTNLLFSFEKMAIRDAIKEPKGAEMFARGLFDYLYGKDKREIKFDRWVYTVAQMPRKQTRVLTWPILTVFAFLAQPSKHIFLKPTVTKVAAEEYGFEFSYHSKPTLETYLSVLNFAKRLKSDLKDLNPRDLIDIQSFIWIQGSSEFDE